MSTCPVCRSPERPIFKRRILNKYDVTYYFCAACRFLHTEKPYWLREAYSDAIVASDTGIVRRNLDACGKAAAVFTWMFGAKGEYLDLAGGYGLFTRLMRDIGFDYYWSDQYAENLLARGFETDIESRRTFIGATAFEVLEHLEDPVGFVVSIFEKTACEALLFSTSLYPGMTPPESWWYYSEDSGQHISFFHRTTLDRLSTILGMRLYSNGDFHMLSRRRVSRLAFSLATSRVAAKITPVTFSVLKKSRLESDHATILENLPHRCRAKDPS